MSLRGSFPKQSVYSEIFRDVRNAISREKQIKGGSRAKKIELINGMNAGWKEGWISMTVYEIASEKALAMTSGGPRNDKLRPLCADSYEPSAMSQIAMSHQP